MKPSGDLCKLDHLGRIVIPVKVRRAFDLKDRDALELFIDEDRIILKKYIPTCVFCGTADELIDYKGKKICPGCVSELTAN